MGHSLIIHGRQIGPAELGQVRGLLAAHPDWSRYRLSRELCQVWKWRSPVGQIKDMAARSLLLKLEEQGGWSCPCADAFCPTYQRARAARSRARSFREMGAPGPTSRPVTMETSKCLLASRSSFSCEDR